MNIYVTLMLFIISILSSHRDYTHDPIYPYTHNFTGQNIKTGSIYDLLKTRSDISYFKCQDVESFEYEPFAIAQFPELEPNKGLFAETFVAIIPNGQVCSWHGWVKVDDVILEESIIHLNSLTCQKETLVHYPFTNAKKIKGRVAVITMLFDTVFGHWIYNILGRLALIESCGIEYDWLYVACDKPYMKETLALWGVDLKKIITPFEKNLCIQADQLIFPSHIGNRTPQPHEHVVTWVPVNELCKKWNTDPKLLHFSKKMNLYHPTTDVIPSWVPIENCFLRWTPLCNYFSKWVINYVRNRFLPAIDMTKYHFAKKIFISRKDANTRKMINEDEIFALFKPFGFERYILTQMTIAEQIALFHNADIIVSAIGSNLTHITFCKPHTAIIEIFQAFSDATFYYMSQNLNLDHYSIQTMKFQDALGACDTIVPPDIIQNFINTNHDLFDTGRACCN